MSGSDSEWGALVAHDDEMAELWDGYGHLPEAGENPALDAFVERKRITINSLVRLGARLADHDVLAFAGPGWLKYRDIVTDRRWSYAACDWSRLKLVRHGPAPSRAVIVVEGETDGARLSAAYPCDVAILPAGAMYFPNSYAAQLAGYELILAGLDNDTAGEDGSRLITAALPQAVRWPPPDGFNDWCSVDADLPELPDPDDFRPPVESQILVNAGDLLDLEPPPVVSWYEHALLPVAGQLILHGAWKSFKSFLSLDLLAMLAQGQDWCCFEPTEEPCRVAVLQYEIPWAYYQQRVRMLEAHAREPELFRTNFLTFTPLRRPQFVAGNTGQEDLILQTLEKQDVQVFLLDPVRRATGVADLNSEKEVRPLLAFFQRVQDIGVTVVTTHHDNKAYVRGGGGESAGMTGSGAFAGDADTIVSVSLPKGLTLEDPQRNLHFLMRNAPSVGTRSMSMSDSRIVYSTSPIGLTDDEDRPYAAEPAI